MRIYSYGARVPTEGAEEVDRLAQLAHRYRNALVEIERDRRAAYRALEREVAGAEMAAQLDGAQAEEKETYRALREARSRGVASAITSAANRQQAARLALEAARTAYRGSGGPAPRGHPPR